MRATRSIVSCVLSFVAPVLLPACGEQGLTYAEAQVAFDEAGLSSEASALTSSTVEISTNFTIGEAVQNAASELRTFIQSQLPCAEITLVDATLTIEYGVNGGDCTYRGQTYSGSHSITVTANDATNVVVEHVWDQMQNQTVEVSGTATVTWSFDDLTRHVVHEAEWTRLADDFSCQGSGDRTQQPLTGGLIEGFSVAGNNAWTSENGAWDLDINDVEMRWIDPVPQAGSYVLDTPYGAQLTMTFARVSDTKIEVTVDTGRRTWTFEVTTLPDV